MSPLLSDYRERLREEFAARCARNRHYSLRGFARDLDLRPSHLSDVLKGKLGLSAKSAGQVARAMGMSDAERAHFVTAVEARHARSPERRKRAHDQLTKTALPDDYRTLDAHVFEIISDWHHYAILELCQTDDFVPRVGWVADRLQMNRIEVEQAVKRLRAVGLLEIKKGRWIATEKFPAAPSGIPSRAIKKFHAQILEKAREALYEQTVEKRDFSTMTFSVNPEDLPEIKDELRAFRRALEKKYKARANRREVYALSTQFFSLSQPVRKFSRASLSEVTDA